MTRADGFMTADVDTGLLDDAKNRVLWRRLQDPALMCQAVTIHLATLLASWGAGERATVDESVPVWLDPAPAVLEALVAVGLLTTDHRLPEHAWDGWFGPAWTRREERRESGRKGGLAKANRTPSPSRALAEPERSQSEALPGPSGPSLPTRPSSRRRARNATGEGTTTPDDACGICGQRIEGWTAGVQRTPDGYVHERCTDALLAGAVPKEISR